MRLTDFLRRPPVDHHEDLVELVRGRFGTAAIAWHRPAAVRLALRIVGGREDVSGREWARVLHAASLQVDAEYRAAYERRCLDLRRANLEASGLHLTGAGDVERVVRRELAPCVALDAAAEWLRELDGDGRAVLHLFGPCDSGKTIAAAWVIAHHRWRAPVALRPDELARALRPDRYADSPDVERIAGADLLVLDDLGTEAVPWFAAVLLSVIEARMGARAPTIITSNVAPPSLERYGERLASRAALWRHVACPRLGMRGELPLPPTRVH